MRVCCEVQMVCIEAEYRERMLICYGAGLYYNPTTHTTNRSTVALLIHIHIPKIIDGFFGKKNGRWSVRVRWLVGVWLGLKRGVLRLNIVNKCLYAEVWVCTMILHLFNQP